MPSNLMSPTSVVVSAQISFHEAIAAVEYFADKYPAERLCLLQAERLERAASAIRTTLEERDKAATSTTETLPCGCVVSAGFRCVFHSQP